MHFYILKVISFSALKCAEEGDKDIRKQYQSDRHDRETGEVIDKTYNML